MNIECRPGFHADSVASSIDWVTTLANHIRPALFHEECQRWDQPLGTFQVEGQAEPLLPPEYYPEHVLRTCTGGLILVLGRITFQLQTEHHAFVIATNEPGREVKTSVVLCIAGGANPPGNVDLKAVQSGQLKLALNAASTVAQDWFRDNPEALVPVHGVPLGSLNVDRLMEQRWRADAERTRTGSLLDCGYQAGVSPLGKRRSLAPPLEIEDVVD